MDKTHSSKHIRFINLIISKHNHLANPSHNASFKISWKAGVPSPVTGSHPSVAFQLAPGTIGVGTPDQPWQPEDPP